MRLRNFRVKGFKSITDIRMENLDNFTILVGENNTGKSNIIDAIHVFISNSAPMNTNRNTNHPDELWPGAIREQDIEWEAEIDFLTTEFTELIEKSGLNQTKVMKQFGPGKWTPATGGLKVSGLPFVKIKRSLGCDRKRWRNELVQVNDLIYFASGEWTPDINIDVIGRMDSQIMEKIFESIKRVDLVRGSVSRGDEANRTQYTGSRSSIVPNETLESIVNIFTKWTDANIKRRKEINKLFGILTSGCQVKASGTRIVIEEGKSETPVHTVGGGIQEMLQLAYELSEDSDILLLEEPESHLHPRLTQKLFHELKKMSENRQIFISTHSTTFIDQADFSNIWLVTKGEEGTKCERIQTDADFPRIADELGILPSYAGQSNCLFFVEGKSDRILFTKWFDVMGFPIRRPVVYMMEMNGKDAGKYKANFWSSVAKALPKLGLGLVFDSDLSPRDKDDIGIAIQSENRVWRLNKGTIEDYYALEQLKSAVISEIEMGEELKTSIERMKEGGVAKQISKILGDKQSWKVSVARILAGACTSIDDIPSEIRELLEEMIEFLKSKSIA